MIDDRVLHDDTPHSDTPLRRKRAWGRRLTDIERQEAQQTFIETFARVGIKAVACRAANVDRTTVDWWSEHDEEFAIEYNRARADADDVIRSEIHRRGINGVDRPIYQGGQQVGTVREYSDVLLIFLAKSRMPEFRDRDRRAGVGSPADSIPLDLLAEAIDEMDRLTDEANV